MELTFECPACRMIDHTDHAESASQALCRHCKTSRPLRPRSFDPSGSPTACPVCGCGELYVRKDFPQGLGLVVVVAGFVTGSIFWYYGRPTSAYSTLGAALLLDFALYRWMPDVLVCYRCASQLRGAGVNPGRRFRSFDLVVGERHRQERLRARELLGREGLEGPGADADAT